MHSAAVALGRDAANHPRADQPPELAGDGGRAGDVLQGQLLETDGIAGFLRLTDGDDQVTVLLGADEGKMLVFIGDEPAQAAE